MKYADIKKLTRTANYAVDVPLNYIKREIEEYKEDLGLQMCPDFQRGHVWTEEQQVAYVEYLFRGGTSGRDIYFNCPTWNRSNNTCGSYSDFVLVDGLQRLTAVIKYLNNELRIFSDDSHQKGYLCSDFEDGISILNSLRFHINDLKTRAEVLKWYLEMNSGGTPHSKYELDRVNKLYLDEINSG